MARQKLNVAPHIRRIKAHHKRHKKKLLGLYHKVWSHPGCYKPGYGPRRGKFGKAPRTHPRMPKGLNKKGAGLWNHIKKAWKWVTGHKVVQHLKKEAIKHGKQAATQLAAEAKRRGKAYIGAQAARGKQWLKDQADAAATRVRKKVEGHLNEASKKVEAVANKVNSAVSGYTGMSSGMPGKTVGAKKGEGWLGDAFRRGVGRFARNIYRRGTRR